MQFKHLLYGCYQSALCACLYQTACFDKDFNVFVWFLYMYIYVLDFYQVGQRSHDKRRIPMFPRYDVR